MKKIPLELRRTAWHEAGHSLVGHSQFGNYGSVTIIPERGGRVLGRQHTDRIGLWSLETLTQMLSALPDGPNYAMAAACARIRHLLAGRAAESLLLGRLRPRFVLDDDTTLALRYTWIACGKPPRDEECPIAEWVLVSEWRRTRDWLKKHLRHLRRFANTLLRKRTLSANQVASLMLPIRDRPSDSGALRDLLRKTKAKEPDILLAALQRWEN